MQWNLFSAQCGIYYTKCASSSSSSVILMVSSCKLRKFIIRHSWREEIIGQRVSGVGQSHRLLCAKLQREGRETKAERTVNYFHCIAEKCRWQRGISDERTIHSLHLEMKKQKCLSVIKQKLRIRSTQKKKCIVLFYRKCGDLNIILLSVSILECKMF